MGLGRGRDENGKKECKAEGGGMEKWEWEVGRKKLEEIVVGLEKKW